MAKLGIGVSRQVGFKLGPIALIIPDLLAGGTVRDQPSERFHVSQGALQLRNQPLALRFSPLLRPDVTLHIARADDQRFDNYYAKINNPSVKVAILEGEMSQTVKAEDFPKAQTVSMTSLADINQVLLQVTTGKADVAMTEPSSSEEFILKNPGKLRRVPGPSLRMQPGGRDVAVGEDSLRNLLNTTLESLQATGFFERVIRKHATGPDQFYLPAPRWGQPVKPLEGQKQ